MNTKEASGGWGRVKRPLVTYPFYGERGEDGLEIREKKNFINRKVVGESALSRRADYQTSRPSQESQRKRGKVVTYLNQAHFLKESPKSKAGEKAEDRQSCQGRHTAKEKM